MMIGGDCRLVVKKRTKIIRTTTSRIPSVPSSAMLRVGISLVNPLALRILLVPLPVTWDQMARDRLRDGIICKIRIEFSCIMAQRGASWKLMARYYRPAKSGNIPPSLNFDVREDRAGRSAPN
jgi:hypothetical protein